MCCCEVSTLKEAGLGRAHAHWCGPGEDLGYLIFPPPHALHCRVAVCVRGVGALSMRNSSPHLEYYFSSPTVFSLASADGSIRGSAINENVAVGKPQASTVPAHYFPAYADLNHSPVSSAGHQTLLLLTLHSINQAPSNAFFILLTATGNHK